MPILQSADHDSSLFVFTQDDETSESSSVTTTKTTEVAPSKPRHRASFKRCRSSGSTTAYSSAARAALKNDSDTAPTPFSSGVKELGAEVRAMLLDNLDRVALHLDMDGTLTAAGQPLGHRAIRLIQQLQVLGVPVSCNTAQSHAYLLAAGGGVFGCCVNELGLRVQHADGTVERAMPPNFQYELALAREFLAERPHFPMLLVEKAGGFAFKFSNALGKRAAPWQVQEAMDLVQELAADNDELTYVQTDGFVDLCSAVLSKRFGASVQMAKAPFVDCFAIGAGDGVTDERLFEVCDLAIKVGAEPSRCADARVSSHDELLDVLEFIVEARRQQQRTAKRV